MSSANKMTVMRFAFRNVNIEIKSIFIEKRKRDLRRVVCGDAVKL